MKLSISDYKKILKFYKLSVTKNKKKLEKKANKIIADKFCSCIKKVQQKFREEGIAIGICTNSVINRKGYKRGNFKCKKRRTINLHKGGKRKKKTRRKRKKKTRRKRGKGGVFSCKNCGDKKKKKERDFYYEDGVKKYFYDSDYSSFDYSDISDEDLKSMAYYEKESIKEQPNKRPVSPLLSEKEQQDARLSPTFGQFAKIETYRGGKRRRKTRKKRGGMESNTPPTRRNTPTTVEPGAQQAPSIPPIALPPPAIPQLPNITSFNAIVPYQGFEDIMLFNMRQAIIGSTDAGYIFEILTLYLNDYNRRVEDRQFTPEGNFGELLNNDVNNFRNYVQYLNQSGGCFPNCKKIKKKCVGCLKPTRVEPTPLGVVMDERGNIIQDGTSSLGVEISDEDGAYEVWILNRRIARLNREGQQIQKLIEKAETPFQKGQLQEMFDKKKKEWEEATKKLQEEEEKIAATVVAYPAEPLSMRR